MHFLFQIFLAVFKTDKIESAFLKVVLCKALDLLLDVESFNYKSIQPLVDKSNAQAHAHVVQGMQHCHAE